MPAQQSVNGNRHIIKMIEQNQEEEARKNLQKLFEQHNELFLLKINNNGSGKFEPVGIYGQAETLAAFLQETHLPTVKAEKITEIIKEMRPLGRIQLIQHPDISVICQKTETGAYQPADTMFFIATKEGSITLHVSRVINPGNMLKSLKST